MATSRHAIHRRFGGPEILDVEVRDVPVPDADEVLVRVWAAGVNPVDWKIFSGEPLFDPYDRTLPSGTGYDFSGVIADVGRDVGSQWRVGDRVFGGLRFHAMADHLVIRPEQLARVPDGVDMLVAGALNVAGRTAAASVQSQHIEPTDTVLVSGAAGGVGILTAQLVAHRGARVLGTASRRNHDLLRRFGIEPIEYGDDLVERLRSAAPAGIDVVLDTVGHGTVAAALALGIAPARINTIADYPARELHGVRGIGGAAAGIPELEALSERIAKGALHLPIDSVHPLERIRDAYARSIAGHATGKIVVAMTAEAVRGVR